jgi:hypothetical protein
VLFLFVKAGNRGHLLCRGLLTLLVVMCHISGWPRVTFAERGNL